MELMEFILIAAVTPPGLTLAWLCAPPRWRLVIGHWSGLSCRRHALRMSREEGLIA